MSSSLNCKSHVQTLMQEERQVTSYLTLATRTLETFGDFTKSIKKPFLKPEIADRLTAMLNINLKQLCGERARELKVENREKYGWKPHEMLKLLTDLYLNLQCTEFIDFLAKEERSYNPALFDTAIKTMTKTGIISEDGIHQWKMLAQKVRWISKKKTRYKDALFYNLIIYYYIFYIL